MSGSASAELAGRVILVTGASRGIGRAVAIACAAAGATVIASGRDVRALGEVADAVVEAGGESPVLLPLNLEGATVADYETVAAHIDGQFGRLDGLVLNAAALGELAPLAHQDPLLWARVFQVNVHSAFLLLQACQGLLEGASGASVVFTLAAEGEQARANWGAYAVSKYALRGLMDLAVGEYAPGDRVRVNGVMPPPARTRLRRNAFPAADADAFADPRTLCADYLLLLGPRGAGRHGEVRQPGDRSAAPA